MISLTALENVDSQLMKQTVIQFKSSYPRKFRKSRQLSTIQMPNPEKYQFQQQSLKPKLPSKKLFDEPKFFMSLERRKNKILDGLKMVHELETSHQQKRVQRKKKKDRATTSQKKSSTLLENHDLYLEASRLGWHPNNKTPFLNFNMQYLIRKRKSMTPNLQRKNDKFYQTIHSTRIPSPTHNK